MSVDDPMPMREKKLAKALGRLEVGVGLGALGEGWYPKLLWGLPEKVGLTARGVWSL